MLKQNLSQKLSQKLSPQQIQLVKLLEIPTDEFEKRIKEELEQNMALEGDLDYSSESSENFDQNSSNSDSDSDLNNSSEDVDFQKTEEQIDLSDYLNHEDDGYKTYANNYSGDNERSENPISQSESFNEYLLSQLRLRELPEKIITIAETIIGNITEEGYFKRDLDAIIDDLAFGSGLNVELDEVEKALEVVQDLEPVGVGARSLQECLLLQLKKSGNKNEPVIQIAIKLLENHYEDFTNKHFEKIQRKLGVEDEDLRMAVNEIISLNPKPGNAFSSGNKNMRTIIPDFILTIEEGEMHLSLNAKNAPQLRISPQYTQMFDDYNKTKSNKDTTLFIKQKIDSARWFIDAVKQRQDTLMMVMRAIINFQRDYFLDGDETKLKPMVLQNIADMVGLDVSTVSRTTQGKYIDTPYGNISLKSLFSESLSTDSGEEVSTREVKKILSELISEEEKKKPLTDDRLAEILNEKGYNIARRTVAKYREQMGIPVARLRKEI